MSTDVRTFEKLRERDDQTFPSGKSGVLVDLVDGRRCVFLNSIDPGGWDGDIRTDTVHSVALGASGALQVRARVETTGVLGEEIVDRVEEVSVRIFAAGSWVETDGRPNEWLEKNSYRDLEDERRARNEEKSASS